jgi:hypothetical protein
MEMKTLGVILAVPMTVAVVYSALAGGSVSPEEVMALVKSEPQLSRELKGRAKGEQIECTAARVGRDVAKQLGRQGGERVGNSYDCEVGRSRLKLNVGAPEGKGRSARKSGLSWEWSD